MSNRCVSAIVLALFVAFCGIIPAPARGATQQQIEKAVQKAKEVIYKAQNKEGNWESSPKVLGDGNSETTGRQWGGLTAIATYALLAAGEPRTDPRVASGIEFLKHAEMKGIYAVGLRCQVWLLLGEDRSIKPFLRRDADILLGTLYKKGPDTGFFSYYYDKGPQPLDYSDHSVSQYGVLGLWALEQGGIDIPEGTWRMMDLAWRKHQNTDGGWSYRYSPTDPLAISTPPMTAAGVASLFITQDYTQPDAGNCHNNLGNENIERGLNWIDAHIHDVLETSNFYCMYGIERIGVASGRKYFGTSDWYQRGAEALIKSQYDDGTWGRLQDTCFVLLFLTRGRAPVLMNKLQYENVGLTGRALEGPWNERPRDCANLARWMGHNLERDLNWQIVNLKVAPEDLHDAPILYISGSDELRLSDKDVANLRTYVEQGGMIVANADCGKKPFADSVLKLGAKLFPNYAFRELEATHPIYTNQPYPSVNWKSHPSVLGLSNGVRELVVLVPQADLSRAWQMRHDKLNPDAYQLGADIFIYAFDKKNLRYRGDTTVVKSDPKIIADKTVRVARLMAGDNPDPEPGGWPRLSAILHNQFHTDLIVKPVRLGEDKLADFKVAHLTGTTKLTLTPEQRAQLVAFVLHGGTLVIDAAGGSREFAESASAELKQMFSAEASRLNVALPPYSPLYTLPEAPLESVSYRSFMRKALGGDSKSPQVRAIDHGGRMAVFFSREDISAGLVGESVDGISGYSPDSAVGIMRNILLYAGKK
ncbi:MAG: Prenyltransferase and squalene oxidase repeat protein [Phycisphaerales bacterium]|nr:Prenyltransferase and squalene oxidase repeat protein [Phycisphaerales bacterium]